MNILYKLETKNNLANKYYSLFQYYRVLQFFQIPQKLQHPERNIKQIFGILSHNYDTNSENRLKKNHRYMLVLNGLTVKL